MVQFHFPILGVVCLRSCRTSAHCPWSTHPTPTTALLLAGRIMHAASSSLRLATRISPVMFSPRTRGRYSSSTWGGGDSSAHGTHNVLTGHPDFSRVTDAAGDLMNDTDDLLNDTILALQSPKDPAAAVSQEELHRQHETASWRTQHKKRKVNNGSDVFLNNLSPVLSFFVSTWCLYFITIT